METYNVRNRSSSRVCYVIPEAGIRREFAPGETKKISFDELEKLSYQAGGQAMMTHFLQIQSTRAIEDLNIHAEPEYNMDENQIVELLKSGDLDRFLDCLDYAPVGVIDLVKKYAVEHLENSAKIDALKEKTGFDVLKARANKKAEEEEKPKATAPTGRRVAVEETKPETEKPQRRTSGDKYKVIEDK